MHNATSLIPPALSALLALGCLQAAPSPERDFAAPAQEDSPGADPGVWSPPAPDADAGAPPTRRTHPRETLPEPSPGATDPASDEPVPQPCFEWGSDWECPAGQVCDFDHDSIEDRLLCQPPCQLRGWAACWVRHYCDPQDGLCYFESCHGCGGCMTSETCEDGDECCSRDGMIPVCGAGACGLNPCRNTAQCAEGQLCVDDECVSPEERPVFCEGHDQCAGRQVCADAGGCALVASCIADQDCPGRLTCDPESGRCDECEEDSDCLSAGIGVVCGDSPSGRYRKCLEPAGGFCEEDGQCTGNRTCNQGFCGPNPELQCEDDWMDRSYANADAQNARPPVIGNHSALQAAPVGAQTYTGLILCDGRDDWFRVELEQGQDVEVTLIYDVNGGTGADLALELREGHTLFGRSDTMGGVERVGLNGAPFDGSYYIRVTGIPGAAATEYALDMRVGDLCVDDPHEGPLGNDRQDNATRLGAGALTDLVLCDDGRQGSGVDFFRIDREPGADTRVEVRWDERDGRVVASMLSREDPIGDGNAHVVRRDTQQSVVWEVSGEAPTPLFVRLHADRDNDWEIRYDISVRSVCSPERRARLCADAPDLPLVPGPHGPDGEPEFFEVRLQADTCAGQGLTDCFSGSCDPLRERHAARELIWRLDTTAPPFDGVSAVDVTVRYAADDDWRGTVSFRSGCEDDAREFSCRLDPRRPYVETLLPGVHHLVVDGSGRECGPFTLELAPSPASAGGVNRCDHCASAAGGVCDLQEAAGWQDRGEERGFRYVLEARGTTSHARPSALGPEVASCIDTPQGPFSPDVSYALSTPAGADQGCRLLARLRTEDFVGGLALRSACPAEEELACQFSDDFAPKNLFVDDLPPGDYTLWVKGADPLQGGDFSLELECTPPGLDRPGRTCAAAPFLPLEPLLEPDGRRVGHEATARGQVFEGRVWHRFTLPEHAEVWFAEIEADFPATFELRRGGCADAVALARGDVDTPIELYELVAGDYRLLVDTALQGRLGGYELDITALEAEVRSPDNDSCRGEHPNPAIGPFELDFAVRSTVRVQGTTAAAHDHRAPQLCLEPGAGGRDVVYRYTADEAHTLSVSITADFAPIFYLRRDDCLDGPEFACAERALGRRGLGPGTFYLFVDGRTPEDAGPFDLQVSFGPP